MDINNDPEMGSFTCIDGLHKDMKSSQMQDGAHEQVADLSSTHEASTATLDLLAPSVEAAEPKKHAKRGLSELTRSLRNDLARNAMVLRTDGGVYDLNHELQGC